jgi:hypothetical protein
MTIVRRSASVSAARMRARRCNGEGAKDIDEIRKPTDIAAASRYAAARISRVLCDPNTTQAERTAAMLLYKRAEAAIAAVRDGEAEMDGAVRHVAARLDADNIRAAEQRKRAAEDEAIAKREEARRWMSNDQFAVAYPDSVK